MYLALPDRLPLFFYLWSGGVRAGATCCATHFKEFPFAVKDEISFFKRLSESVAKLSDIAVFVCPNDRIPIKQKIVKAKESL
jgi:hypothetical protein